MNKQKSAIVSIVGYDPVDDKAGVGGFDWYYDRLDAMTRLHECLANEGNTHFIWFRSYKVNVTGDKKADQITITNQIEKNIVDHGSDGDWE